MSEVQDPVQHSAAATTEPTTTEPAAIAPTDKVAPSGETATTAAAPTGPNTINPIKEEKIGKNEELITSKAINEGVLNYKGPGLKGLIFSKKYFWLSEAPLEHNHLSTYLGNEKSTEIAHPNVAQATQSGKGLLFYTKRAEDKDHPQGILNIADMSDMQKGDFNDFSVKLHGKNHTFQALNKNERDGWVVTLTPLMADAKAHREMLLATPGYKSALDRYSKPTSTSTISKSRSLSRPGKASKSRERVKEATKETPVVGATTAAPAVVDPAAAPTKSIVDDATVANTDKVTDTPVESTTTTAPAHHHGEEAAVGAAGATAGAGVISAAKADKEEKKEEKLEKKGGRSQSRGNKRSSIFGGLLGKKEEKDEKKAIKKEEQEEKKEIKAEEKAETKEIKAEKKEEKAEEKAEKKELKAEEKLEKKEENAVEKDLKHEGTGVAGGFDAAAVASRVLGEPVLGKNAEHSSSTVPATESAIAAPTTTSTTTPVTAPTTGTESKPVVAGEAAADITPSSATSKTPATATTTSKASKRNSVFGGLFGKKDTPRSTAAETGPAVPAKDLPTKSEPSTVASTAPQLDNPIKSPTASTTTGAATETPAAAPASTTAAASEPVAEKAEKALEPAVGGSAAPVTATATTPTDKRRASFFGGLGTKKEKSAGATSGDELTDGEGKKSSGVGGLFRKASRAVSKPTNSGATSTSAAKPAVPATTEPAIKADEKVAETKAAHAIEEPSSKVEPTTESLPTGTEAATSAEKKDELVPGEVGSNAIASHEKSTPVEATA